MAFNAVWWPHLQLITDSLVNSVTLEVDVVVFTTLNISEILISTWWSFGLLAFIRSITSDYSSLISRDMAKLCLFSFKLVERKNERKKNPIYKLASGYFLVKCVFWNALKFCRSHKQTSGKAGFSSPICFSALNVSYERGVLAWGNK